MIKVVVYVGTDGIIHAWDAANRGGAPLCHKDVFYKRIIEIAGIGEECDDCLRVCVDLATSGKGELL